MTTRIHRLWQPGNPQTRVFLPNFWMKVVYNPKPHPPYIVKFEVPLEMTRHDVREYLTKIYDLPVRDVRTDIKQGEMIRHRVISKQNDFMRGGQITKVLDKKPDQKFAYVVFKKDLQFEFPMCILPESGSEEKSQEKMSKLVSDVVEKQIEGKIKFKPTTQPGVPSWFA